MLDQLFSKNVGPTFLENVDNIFKNIGNIFLVDHHQMGELGKKMEKKKIRLRWALVGWKFELLSIYLSTR
jgi:hypothetical protein